MKKDLPGIYKNQISKKIQNNKSVYHLKDTNDTSYSKHDDDYGNVEEKLKKLFKTTRYVFNIRVIIETEKKTYDTKIAGQVKNSIVTVDGEVIPIVEIKNIIIKDRL